ncbi:MAG: type II toxin-antitoxin system Phd/YefM family antitoxin [Rhizomicrobium sp.]
MNVTIVKIHEAKTQLSRLVARAEAGEEVVIARDDNPVVKLTPLENAQRRPGFGSMKGKWPDLPDIFFFDPLPEEELRAWEGCDDEDSLR